MRSKAQLRRPFGYISKRRELSIQNGEGKKSVVQQQHFHSFWQRKRNNEKANINQSRLKIEPFFFSS